MLPFATIALGLLAASCSDNHSVSPWGEAGRPRLADYAVRPDLDAHVSEIAAEASRLGLVEAFRVAAKDPRSGDPLIAIALEGHDDVGRRVTATRIASPWAVVLARGPHDLRDVTRMTATELLQSVVLASEDEKDVAGALSAFADLTHDGTPDVVLRSERGALEVWSMTSRGGTQVNTRMEVTPSRFVDVGSDGGFDLSGRVVVDAGDALAPALVDVATWAGDAFANTTPEARAFHARHRDWSRTAEATARDDATRARRALEVAWHAILAGGNEKRELAALADKRPSGVLGDAFDAHARRVGRIGK